MEDRLWALAVLLAALCWYSWPWVYTFYVSLLRQVVVHVLVHMQRVYWCVVRAISACLAVDQMNGVPGSSEQYELDLFSDDDDTTAADGQFDAADTAPAGSAVQHPVVTQAGDSLSASAERENAGYRLFLRSDQERAGVRRGLTMRPTVAEEAAPLDFESSGPVDEENVEGDDGMPMQDRLGLRGESPAPGGALNPWIVEDSEDEAGDVGTPSQDRLLPRFTVYVDPESGPAVPLAESDVEMESESEEEDLMQWEE